MGKIKSTIITVLVMTLFAIVASLTYRNFYHAFMWVGGFFAVFGFFRFGVDIRNWMSIPVEKTEGKHRPAHVVGYKREISYDE